MFTWLKKSTAAATKNQIKNMLTIIAIDKKMYDHGYERTPMYKNMHILYKKIVFLKQMVYFQES